MCGRWRWRCVSMPSHLACPRSSGWAVVVVVSFRHAALHEHRPNCVFFFFFFFFFIAHFNYPFFLFFWGSITRGVSVPASQRRLHYQLHFLFSPLFFFFGNLRFALNLPGGEEHPIERLLYMTILTMCAHRAREPPSFLQWCYGKSVD